MEKHNVLLNSLQKYYMENRNSSKLLEILKEDNKISLRIIDWFVTNYSKKNNIYYSIFETPTKKKTFVTENNKIVKQFNTYHSYKSQLKSFSKKKFDPFCRRDRITFDCNGTPIETTVGQLNFFKWAIDNLIIEYIKIHYDAIEDDMNTCYNGESNPGPLAPKARIIPLDQSARVRRPGLEPGTPAWKADMLTPTPTTL